MTVILGIDASWTSGQPSGVAVFAGGDRGWCCPCAAPSYQSFIDFASGHEIDWLASPANGVPDVGELLKAASSIAKAEVDLVAVDMPLSLEHISARRSADDIVSRVFGGNGCSTHSPSEERPGKLGADLTAQFRSAGFALATTETCPGTSRCLMEVYPHIALLALLNRTTRVPYKASKSKRYWPTHNISQRVAAIASELLGIEQRIQLELRSMPSIVPDVATYPQTLANLKRFEDAIDAVVCCWVAALYHGGNAVPLGDATAAIWCPTSALSLAKNPLSATVH